VGCGPWKELEDSKGGVDCGSVHEEICNKGVVCVF